MASGIVEKIEEGVKKAAKVVEDVVEKEEVEEVVDKITGKKKDSEESEEIETADEKEAESESTDEKKVATLEEKKKALLAKAAKLKEKISDGAVSSEDLKEQVKIKKKSEMLIPLEDYVKSGIYLGTRAVTPSMKPYVYRRRADGLAIFNTDLIDEKLKEAIEFLGKFDAEDVIVVCKREAGWRAVEMFSKLTGIRAFTKKYPAGILTNTNLSDFFENELTIVTDQWIDKNAMQDTMNVKKQVLMICDTNNFAKGATQLIIGNNKSPKSIGVIYYLLTRGYMKAKGLDTTKIPDLDWWTGEVEDSQKGASFGV